MFQARFVPSPVARHENEAIEHHTGSKYGNIFHRLLQDDIDMSVHFACVRYPPQIEPVSIQLMIGYHDKSLGKVCLQPTVFRSHELASDTLVPADSNRRRAEPLGEGNDQQAESLLGQSHISVVIVSVDGVERCPQVLRSTRGSNDRPKPGGEGDHSHDLNPEPMFDPSARMGLHSFAFDAGAEVRNGIHDSEVGSKLEDSAAVDVSLENEQYLRTNTADRVLSDVHDILMQALFLFRARSGGYFNAGA